MNYCCAAGNCQTCKDVRASGKHPSGVISYFHPGEEPTTEFVMAERCPNCRSLDTEPFETHIDGTKHCLPCGRVFR